MSKPRVCDLCEKPATESSDVSSMWWCDYECCSMECVMLAEAEPA
jgi:hypothetical protein